MSAKDSARTRPDKSKPDKRRQELARQRKRQDSRRWLIIGGVAAVVVIVAVIAGFMFSQRGNNGGFAAGSAVDGVQCPGQEMLAYHIHAALTLYDHGTPVAIPGFVGQVYGPSVNQPGNSCLYYLHTHSFDSALGIVHIESPNQQTYTLGQFLDIWHYTAIWDASPQLINSNFVDALAVAKPGDVHVYINGKPVSTNYRNVTLAAHELITVELGKPLKPPTTKVNFPNGE